MDLQPFLTQIENVQTNHLIIPQHQQEVNERKEALKSYCYQIMNEIHTTLKEYQERYGDLTAAVNSLLRKEPKEKEEIVTSR